MRNIFTKLFGSRNQRLLREYGRYVTRANAFEADLQALSDDELRGRTDRFRERLAAGEDLGARLKTIHNLHYYLRLMARIRAAIDSGGFGRFAVEFLAGPEASRSRDSRRAPTRV